MSDNKKNYAPSTITRVAGGWLTDHGYLIPELKIKGGVYLPSVWRIAWFKSDFPHFSIETKLLSYDTTQCLIQAIIKDDTGRVLATGMKRCVSSGMSKEIYVEKAETQAIARALGAFGYKPECSELAMDESDITETSDLLSLADSPSISKKDITYADDKESFIWFISQLKKHALELSKDQIETHHKSFVGMSFKQIIGEINELKNKLKTNTKKD